MPKSIVSDNGSCFTFDEFSKFVKQNGIQHIQTAPYHPASNGLAERAVQIIKNCVKQMVGGNMKNKMADGRIASRHQDHIRLRFSEDDTCDMEENIHIENSPLIKPNMVKDE